MQPQGQGMERDEKERENGGISKGAEQAWEERPGMSRDQRLLGSAKGTQDARVDQGTAGDERVSLCEDPEKRGNRAASRTHAGPAAAAARERWWRDGERPASVVWITMV